MCACHPNASAFVRRISLSELVLARPPLAKRSQCPHTHTHPSLFWLKPFRQVRLARGRTIGAWSSRWANGCAIREPGEFGRDRRRLEHLALAESRREVSPPSALPFVELEELLVDVSEVARARISSPVQLQCEFVHRWHRQLARRVEKAARCRNTLAHPDVALRRVALHAFGDAGGEHDPGEVKGDTAQAEEGGKVPCAEAGRSSRTGQDGSAPHAFEASSCANVGRSRWAEHDGSAPAPSVLSVVISKTAQTQLAIPPRYTVIDVRPMTSLAPTDDSVERRASSHEHAELQPQIPGFACERTHALAGAVIAVIAERRRRMRLSRGFGSARGEQRGSSCGACEQMRSS